MNQWLQAFLIFWGVTIAGIVLGMFAEAWRARRK